MNLGRDKLPWGSDIWDRIDKAVHDECKRTKIAAKFLPIVPVSSETLTVASDIIDTSDTLNINEADTVQIIEILVEFTLTPQQVERESELRTAETLATRAANLISTAEDLIIFLGPAALKQPIFTAPRGKKPRVVKRSGTPKYGLLTSIPDSAKSPSQNVEVKRKVAGTDEWGDTSFKGISKAYANLQGGLIKQQAHYGPYAAVFNYVPYADSFAPLAGNQLLMPADRIKPLMDEGFYGTGTVSDHADPLKGIVASLGGNTMDLVIGRDATAAFLQENNEGQFLFRVFERFALRLKDLSSLVRLDFNVDP